MSVTNGNKDGFDQLDYFYRATIPFLGLTDFDPYKTIQLLIVTDGMQLETFIAEAQDIQMQLEIAAIANNENALLKQFLEQLMLTNLQPLLANKNHQFNQFRKQNPLGKAYTEETIDTIADYLIDGNAPSILRLLDKPNIPGSKNHPDAFYQGLDRHRQHSSYSKPTYATMNSVHTIPEFNGVKPQDPTEVTDDSTVTDGQPLEIDETIKEMVKPMFAILKVDDPQVDDEIWNDLCFKAMRAMGRSPRPQCDACHQHHDTDECWARGPEFQDEALRKRVQQINATRGNKPINPPKPRIPPKASFKGTKVERGGRPQLKSMAISYLKDQDDQQQFDLQYRSVQNSADIETVLDEVSDDLKNALDKDELLVQPKLAVLQVSSTPAESNDTRGPEDAMRVADYSVYNEQVNF